MQIVIEIPDGYVKVIMANQRTEGSAMDKLIRQAVIDGTPLPKGHGRLKDIDAIIDTLDSSDRDIYVKECLEEDTPTIIPADKAESEEE